MSFLNYFAITVDISFDILQYEVAIRKYINNANIT